MRKRTVDGARKTDTFPSVFPLPVNRLKLSQRNALHSLALALEGAMAFDERISVQAVRTHGTSLPGFPILKRAKGRTA